jgi:hypothetical protein
MEQNEIHANDFRVPRGTTAFLMTFRFVGPVVKLLHASATSKVWLL